MPTPVPPSITIRIPNAGERLPLHRSRGSGQTWDAWLWIDTRAESATWAITYPDNTTPIEVHHGFDHRIECSPFLTSEQLAALVQRLGPLVARVCDGTTHECNGRNSVGVLDEDAQEALDEITAILEPCEEDTEVEVCGIEDHLVDVVKRRTRAEVFGEVEDDEDDKEDEDEDGNEEDDGEEHDDKDDPCDIVAIDVHERFTISALTSDDELDAEAERLDEQAWRHQLVLEGTLQYLHELRDECVQ